MENANKQPRNFRIMLPPPENPGNGLGYAFLTLAHPKQTLEGETNNIGRSV
jgi:hypothetical protein